MQPVHSLPSKGVIGKYVVTGLNENRRYLLLLCCSNGLRIMNTFFQHREVYKHTWYRSSMDQKSLIDFCIVLSDLFSDVLDVRVKRGAELSTDHHLVVCFTTFETLAIQLVVCDLPVQMGGFGGQRSKKTVCIQYII